MEKIITLTSNYTGNDEDLFFYFDELTVDGELPTGVNKDELIEKIVNSQVCMWYHVNKDGILIDEEENIIKYSDVIYDGLQLNDVDYQIEININHTTTLTDGIRGQL